jgi:hypothetical protein
MVSNSIKDVPGGKVNILEVIVSVILSKKVYVYRCLIPKRFRDTAISLYSSKIVHKNEILRTVSNTVISAAARVRARVWSCRICGGQSGVGACFLPVLRFPLPIFIPPVAPQSPSSIIWGLYNRPEVAAVSKDLVPPHKIKK